MLAFSRRAEQRAPNSSAAALLKASNNISSAFAMSFRIVQPAFATIVDVFPDPAAATSCTRLSKQITARACSSVSGVFSIRSKKSR